MMDIKDKVRAFTWKKWLQRGFSPFFVSLFKDGGKREYYERLGFHGVDCKAMLCQNGFWYESPEVWDDMTKKLNDYLENHSIFDVSKTLEDFYKENKRVIKDMVKEEGDVTEQLRKLYDILTLCTSFIWMAHGLEEVYKKRLKEEVPKYVDGDIDKFIGDASFPKKKTAHALMEDVIRNGEDPAVIVKEFGWIKARERFTEPFSVDEIKEMAKTMGPEHHVEVKIPDELKQLFEEAQELVYFRTARTDVFYEFIFLSRPILDKAAVFLGVKFNDAYTIQGLIDGTLERFDQDHYLATYEDEEYLGEEKIIEEESIEGVDQIEGSIAYPGMVQGKAKIILNTSDLRKVEDGDILVAQMTFPSFMIAMKKAAAFVTDEGSITCHAAIIAREMKKPCVIGTKIATTVFKDGDMIEVDADKGTARKVR